MLSAIHSNCVDHMSSGGAHLARRHIRSDVQPPSATGIYFPSAKQKSITNEEAPRETYGVHVTSGSQAACDPGSCDGHTSIVFHRRRAVATFVAPIVDPHSTGAAARRSSPGQSQTVLHVSAAGGFS